MILQETGRIIWDIKDQNGKNPQIEILNFLIFFVLSFISLVKSTHKIQHV